MERPGAWKLGLCATAALLGLYVGLVVLGSARGGRVAVMVTYLDEPVDGLSEGGRVEVRGVLVGHVTGLGLAPDQRHVEIRAALSLTALEQLGLRRPGDPPLTGLRALQAREQHAERALRAYLAPVGITSTMVLQLDLLDPELFPRPDLPFEIPEQVGYVPAVPSSLRSLTLKVDQVVPAVPEYLARGEELAQRVEEVLEGVRGPDLRRRYEARLEQAEALVGMLEPDSVAALSSSLETRTGDLRSFAEAVRAAQASLDDPDGRAARLEATLGDARERLEALDLPGLARDVRELVRSASAALQGMGETLDEARKAARGLAGVARGVRDLVQPLEQDPGGLFYGEDRREGPPR